MEVKESNSIEINALTAGSRSESAIEGLTLAVPRNSVFAFLGAEGAGKSAILRVLVNLLRPKAGTATISGIPCGRLKPFHFTRIGYVSREPAMPEWMEAGEFLRFCRGLYPDWDDAFCETLTKSFKIRPDRTIGSGSPSFQVRLALVAALAFRPPVLLLDDPFREVEKAERDAMIRGIMELIDLDEWSIVITARETDEVERMAEYIALLHEGRLEFSESMASLQRRYRRVEAFVMEPGPPPGGFPQTWLRPRFEGHRLRFIDTRFDAEKTLDQVRALLGKDCMIETHAISVREIFDELDRAYGLSAQS